MGEVFERFLANRNKPLFYMKAREAQRWARTRANQRFSAGEWTEQQFTDRASRLASAIRIVESNGVKYYKDTTFVEASNGVDLYKVDAGSCECEDHKQGHKCKHRLAVFLFNKAVELLTPNQKADRVGEEEKE